MCPQAFPVHHHGVVKRRAHSIDEALLLGRRILVFRRPARIAYTAAIDPGLSAAQRAAIRTDILRVLAAEPEAGAVP